MISEIEKISSKYNIPYEIRTISDHTEAQNADHPYGTFYISTGNQNLDYRPNPKYFTKKFDILE